MQLRTTKTICKPEQLPAKGGVRIWYSKQTKIVRVNTSKRTKMKHRLNTYNFKTACEAKTALMFAIKQLGYGTFEFTPHFYKQSGGWYKLWPSEFSEKVANHIVHYINAKFKNRVQCKMRLVKTRTNKSMYVLLVKQL